MLQILVRNEVVGPSSGTTIVGEEMRVADAREFRVGADDFREIRDAADVRVETRPGMLKGYFESQVLKL